MMTLAQYTTSTQQDVDDTSNAATSVIKQDLIATNDEVMRQVGQYLQGSITEDDTCVINQTAYPVSQDASVVHQVAYRPVGATNFRILYQISLEDYKDNFINRPASLPTVWFLDGDTINVAPKPVEAGTVRRVYTPNIASMSDTVNTILPDRYSKVLILGAISRFKAWENNLAAASYYQGLYQQALRDCVLDLSNRSKPLTPKLY